MAPDPHVCALLLGLGRSPELGYVVRADATGVLNAIVIAPREHLEKRPGNKYLLDKHPDAIAWIAPQSTTRTGKTWRGRGWFPLTTDEWSRLHNDNEHQFCMSEYEYSTAKNRQRDLVMALYGMLERDVITR